MKNIIKTTVFITATLVTLASCKKEGTLNANLDIIDKNVVAKTDVDLWLEQNFLNPYNIEAKFRYDRYELNLGKNITPPLETQVIPAMEMVRDVWIKPFEAAGGANFIKRISPKQFILAGSAEYNDDGTITLGTAEGGRKIVLYVINSFDKNNLASVKQMIQVIQHEYTHILNQTVDYQTDYQTISRGGYAANWTQETLESGRALGFITQYARSAPGEDFAEMSSNMLMLGRVVSNSIINNSGEGSVKLRKKEQMVVDYFKSAFNIDFYALQTEVQNALNKISAPVFADLIGPNIGYTTLKSTPASSPNQSAEFLSLWRRATNNMAATGFVLRDFTMTFTEGNTMTLRYSFSSGATTYFADAYYDMTVNGAGQARFSLQPNQPLNDFTGNMDFINELMEPVNTYFQDNQFNMDWFDKTPGKIGIQGSLGGFYKSTDQTSYFYGTLGS